MTRCIVVVGYNNVRIYDVEKLRAICAREHGFKLVLVTEQVRTQDCGAADVVLCCDMAYGEVERSLDYVVRELARMGLTPAGVLPFSDRGVLLGAALSGHLSLPGADMDDAIAGLDKRILRQREHAAISRPVEYRPVFSRQVHSLDDLCATVALLGGQAFVKPASEGNSRGCCTIHGDIECHEVWAALKPYRAGGLIVEELVENAREYSWDYVAGYQWITEKLTTEGEFRAEYQQIVPAPLNPEARARITAAGFYVQQLVSERNGAYHNEIFLRDDRTTSAVETNMRPGGMHIWDLATRSFAGFDPWRSWVQWALTGKVTPVMLEPARYSGIRMIRAPQCGILKTLPDIAELARELGMEVDEARFSKNVGERVTARPRDNSDFIGEIMLQAQHCDALREQLSRLANAIEQCVEVVPIDEASSDAERGQTPVLAIAR